MENEEQKALNRIFDYAVKHGYAIHFTPPEVNCSNVGKPYCDIQIVLKRNAYDMPAFFYRQRH